MNTKIITKIKSLLWNQIRGGNAENLGYLRRNFKNEYKAAAQEFAVEYGEFIAELPY